LRVRWKRAVFRLYYQYIIREFGLVIPGFFVIDEAEVNELRFFIHGGSCEVAIRILLLFDFLQF